jgi:ribonuclease R
LVGRRWGQAYALGDRVQVRLVAAQPLTGGITFELIEGGRKDQIQPSSRPQKGHRDKPAPSRRSHIPRRGKRKH